MKLATCDNCAHRKGSTCSLGETPAEGEFLCHHYVMTTTFRDEIVAMAQAEYKREVNQAMIHLAVARAEKEKAFAG